VFGLARENVSLTCANLVRRVSLCATDPQDAVMLTRFINQSSAEFAEF
jgi:hypothetical protein